MDVLKKKDHAMILQIRPAPGLISDLDARNLDLDTRTRNRKQKQRNMKHDTDIDIDTMK